MKIMLCEIRSGIISVKQRSSLGIQWSASLLRKNGYDVSVLLFENAKEENIKNNLNSGFYDIVFLEFRSGIRQLSYRVIEHLKTENKDIKIVLMGHDATLHAARFMLECAHIDMVVYGEAELTVVDLCNRFSSHDTADGCEGVFYRKNGIIFRNDARQLPDHLDYLAMPALDIAKAQFGSKMQQTVFLSTRTSRGCLGNCAFCSLNRLTKVSGHIPWRGRSLEDIINELDEMQQEFIGKRLVIEFVDNSFEDPYPIEKKRIYEFMDLLEQSSLKIAFAILTRTESWSEKDVPLIQRMRKNGLYYIAPGVENSTEIGLLKLNKRGNVQSNQRIFDLFEGNNVYVHAYLIMFYPYVTFDELKSNMDFMKKNNMTAYPFNWYHSMALHPDTEIFQRASRDGLITGFNNDTCFYEYQFTDGRIGNLYKMVSKMAAQTSVSSYMDFYEVTRFEEYLYNIWKEQYDYMKTVDSFMSDYTEKCHEILNRAGDSLCKLFSEIFEDFSCNGISNNEEYYIDEWNRILIDGYKSLKNIWVENNMYLLRKNIKLL